MDFRNIFLSFYPLLCDDFSILRSQFICLWSVPQSAHCRSYSIWLLSWSPLSPWIPDHRSSASHPIVSVISNTGCLMVIPIDIETRCPYRERFGSLEATDPSLWYNMFMIERFWTENANNLSDRNYRSWSESAQREARHIYSTVESFVKHFENPSELFDGEMKTWHILELNREISTSHWEEIQWSARAPIPVWVQKFRFQLSLNLQRFSARESIQILHAKNRFCNWFKETKRFRSRLLEGLYSFFANIYTFLYRRRWGNFKALSSRAGIFLKLADRLCQFVLLLY
jgi:hypothetical protein